MFALDVIAAARERLRPSRWGALPLFVGLLLVLRLALGAPMLAFHPRLLAVALPLAGVYYLLAPMPWQYSGDHRLRAGLWRGTLQAVLWDGLCLFLLSILLGMVLPPHAPRPLSFQFSAPHLPRWAMLVVLNLPIAFLAGWFVAEKEAAEAERAASEASARAAQAKALQAQLDPHVLYNALGGLAELVRSKPDAAEEALLDLADLYRSLTALGQKTLIQLGEERKLLEQFLAIEQLRLGTRLRVTWDWPESVDGVLLPPLLVQPLVENALKHGLAPSESGGELRLSARLEGQTLSVRVDNSGLPWAPGPEGTGLGHLRARLALLGGALRVEDRDGWTSTELRLPAGVP